MYEKRYSRFYRSKRFRASFRFGCWFGVALACGFALFSCGIVRHSVLCYQVDTACQSDTDTCYIEVWHRYFPRSVTKFRIKKELEP